MRKGDLLAQYDLAGRSMLGHRGCRLGIHYPEICNAAEAIFEATAKLVRKGMRFSQIEMPLVIHE